MLTPLLQSLPLLLFAFVGSIQLAELTRAFVLGEQAAFHAARASFVGRDALRAARLTFENRTLNLKTRSADADKLLTAKLDENLLGSLILPRINQEFLQAEDLEWDRRIVIPVREKSDEE